jgi:hypothetical protein
MRTGLRCVDGVHFVSAAAGEYVLDTVIFSKFRTGYDPGGGRGGLAGNRPAPVGVSMPTGSFGDDRVALARRLTGRKQSMITRPLDDLSPGLRDLSAKAPYLPEALRDALQASLLIAPRDATPEHVLAETFGRLGYLPEEAKQTASKILATTTTP